jgi:hypothetical protein
VGTFVVSFAAAVASLRLVTPVVLGAAGMSGFESNTITAIGLA